MQRLVWLFLMLFPILGAAQQVEFLHPKVIDVGKVPKGEVIKGELKFVNKSGEMVEIENIRPSCGCTAVTPDKMTYASGDTAIIPYTIETKDFNGLIRKSIKITFKNAEPKSQMFFIQAQVIADININPRFINLLKVPLNPDSTITEFFEIENASEQPIEIERMASSKPFLKIIPESVTIPAGKSHLIRLEFTPEETGRFNAYVTIHTNHKTQPELRLPVFINVVESSKTVN